MRARAGDQDAYALLVRAHAADAYRAAAFLGAGAEAEDVVQVAFVKAYEALPRFRPGAPFRPWLLRIVGNEAKNMARSNGRGRRAAARLAVLDGEVPVADPGVSALSRERRDELVTAVRTLPVAQQRVVACRYFLDLDEKETADVLGLPKGTVKSRLSRALRHLRELLDEEADDDT